MNNEKYGYLYLTTNLINNKKYIGIHKTQTFDESYKGSGKVLWNSIRKYGWDNFKCEILKWCFSKEELYQAEIEEIEKRNAVNSDEYYNLRPGGKGGSLKDFLTEEQLKECYKKIGLANKNRVISDEQRAKLSIRFKGENNPMYGVHLKTSENKKETLSRKLKGRKFSDEHRAKIGKALKNKPKSESAKEKMSQAWNYDKHFSKDTIEKIRKSSIGRKHTDEAKKKIADGNRGKIVSDETKQKIRDYNTKYYIEYNGVKKPIKEWAEIIGVSYETLLRKYKSGINVDEIIKKYFEVNYDEE